VAAWRDGWKVAASVSCVVLYISRCRRALHESAPRALSPRTLACNLGPWRCSAGVSGVVCPARSAGCRRSASLGGTIHGAAGLVMHRAVFPFANGSDRTSCSCKDVASPQSVWCICCRRPAPSQRPSCQLPSRARPYTSFGANCAASVRPRPCNYRPTGSLI
jgi:hypothetical protein